MSLYSRSTHSPKLEINYLADFLCFGTMGFGGSIPLSPTNPFQQLMNSQGHEGLHKRVYLIRAGCWPDVNFRQTLAAAKLTASTRSSHHVRL